MADIASEMDKAFEEVTSTPEPDSAPAAEPEAEPEAPAAAAPAVEAKAEDPALEETGDVLFDKLTPEQIAEAKKDPKFRALHKGLMQSYTTKMQAFAEQQRLWDALNNEGTRRQAVESLARAVGLQIQPHDLPQREKAAEVADTLETEWSNVIGPEAAQALRPLIEKTALAAVQGTIKPLQEASEHYQMDARSRQAESQVSQFRQLAEKNKWTIDPATEQKMAQLGQQFLPAKPIETVEQGVEHLKSLYRLATADRTEADVEKRILERMNKAAQTAEPTRSVPSTGREKRTNVTKEMGFSEAWDVAADEVKSELGLR